MQPMINTLLDPVVNFGKVTVLGGHTDGIDDTEVTLITGDGSKLPNPVPSGSFNLVWFNNSTYSDPADDPYVEIVRCIARVGDTLTLMRGQELTARSNKNIPTKIYKMILSPTKKTIDDIQTESQSKINTHSALSTGIHGVGADTIDGVGTRNAAISTHSSVTSNVHGFDILGDAPAQAHGISRHTGTIGDHIANLSSVGSNTHAEIDTAITASMGHIIAVAPHSGHDTPTQRDTAISNHTGLTTAHGSSGTVLGLTTADSRYAPIAKGVTNGDSHDHSGGDGAQIDHTTLSNIGSNTHVQIDAHISSAGGGIPSGVILMWHGAIANIPSGWVIRNGANGTPDLRSRFVRGAPVGVEAGETGGADTHTLSTAETPAHDHGSAGGHTHNSIADHVHRIYVNGNTGSDGVPKSSGQTVPGWTTTYNSGGGGGHTHSADGTHTHTSVGSGSAHNNMSAYYQIIFIMKT